MTHHCFRVSADAHETTTFSITLFRKGSTHFILVKIRRKSNGCFASLIFFAFLLDKSKCLRN